MAVSVGVPALMVNRFVPPAISLPVVTVTFDAPGDAAAAIVNVAVRWVASVIEIAPAVKAELLKLRVEPAAKGVNCPVMVTPVSTWPGCPLLGLIAVIVGVAAAPTVKRFVPVAISVPVVTVTFDIPAAAPAAMANVAVRCVASITETELAVIPELLKVTVEPGAKCVLRPVMITPFNTWPDCPLLGFMAVIVGAAAAPTVNRLAPVTTSAPVETVTLDAPVAAPAAIVSVAVRCVTSATKTELAVIPGLLNVTVEPDEKCVNCPVTLTAVSTWPASPLLGLSAVSAGVPGVTVNRLAPVTTSLLVVTVTLAAPVAAEAEIASVAVRCVGSVTEMLLAVIPGLLNVTVEADPKCVNRPVMVTPGSTWPCCTATAPIAVIAGVPGVTVNTLTPVATSPPVATVTLESPMAAPEAMVKVAVRCVASVIAMLLAVMPGLAKVTVEPGPKCVNCPVIVTSVRTCPCCPLPTLIAVTAGRFSVYGAETTALSRMPVA